MFSLRRENHEAFATIPHAFAPHEIDMIRSMIETQEKTPGVVADGITDKNIRDSRIKWIVIDASSQWIFERVASIINTVNDQYFGMALTTTEGIQLTEYDSVYQGFYGSHTDSTYGPLGDARTRKLSVTMQLSNSDEYEGGDLMLYHQNLKSPFNASRDKGTMTLFRSHIIHEVTPVTKGIRYSFVTWIHGPLFR
jgi:PKHD-type hydroxylase